jgi:hypothetical protein
MKARSIATIPGVLLACCAVSTPVLAKDNCTGHGIGVGSARVIIQDNRTLPMHLATGECTSTGESASKCTFKDKDGDEWTDVNEWTGVGLEGTWRTVSGTGKYAKATTSHGWWKTVRSDPVKIWAVGGYCALAAKRK